MSPRTISSLDGLLVEWRFFTSDETRDALVAILRRSAEFQAINKALLNGARMENLKVAPIVVFFDDAVIGTDTDGIC